MESIIQVYRMTEVSKEVRIRLIQKLGKAIDDQIGSNITQELVDELINQLNKED